MKNLQRNRVWLVALLCVMVVVGLVACDKNFPKPEAYRLSETSVVYNYQDFSGELLALPTVYDQNGKVVSSDKFVWRQVSGESASLQEGDMLLLKNISGDNVFECVIQGTSKEWVLEYDASVVAGLNGGLASSLEGADYATQPGIGKHRVFGNKKIDPQSLQLSDWHESVSLYPGVGGVGNEDYSVRVTSNGVESTAIDYAFVGDNKLDLVFDKSAVGSVAIKITLEKEDEIGEFPFVGYTFDIVDGINITTKDELLAVQRLTAYNGANDSDYIGGMVGGVGDPVGGPNDNKYTYTKNGTEYTGVDGTHFENIVVRNNIKDIDRVVLFYGSVYGNGYTLDSTPYGDNWSTNSPTSYTIYGESQVYNTACFYMMSDNTVLDNIHLVGDNTEYDSINEYIDSKIVLGIWGVTNTIKLDGTDTDGNPIAYNVDKYIDKIRQPKNIKLLNSHIEKGIRNLSISAAPSPQEPIVIESCAFGYAAENNIWLATDWRRPESDKPTGPDDKKYRSFVTLKNSVLRQARYSPIGYANNVYTKVGVPQYNGYGSKLTLLGDKNYLFAWKKYTEIDLGSVSLGGFLTLDIFQQLMKPALESPKNKDMLKEVVYNYQEDANGNPVGQEDWWLDLSVFGNIIAGQYILNSQDKDMIHANGVDATQSNLASVLTSEKTLRLYETVDESKYAAEVSLWLYKGSNLPADLPKPGDDFNELSDAKIQEMQPAQGI
ncbi:MAG: hypothetical protein FWD76_02695 [Firmicutes bacterium]|nr:hypothetical protein [Bacillota bacterium]